MKFILLALLFVILDFLPIESADQEAIKSWLASPSPELNLFSIFVGDYSNHFSFLENLKTNLPVRVLKGGSENLGTQLVSLLKQTCNIVGCPSQIIFVENAEKIPLKTLLILSQSFFEKKNCVTPEFGGLSIDCSRIWFVLSTNFGHK